MTPHRRRAPLAALALWLGACGPGSPVGTGSTTDVGRGTAPDVADDLPERPRVDAESDVAPEPGDDGGSDADDGTAVQVDAVVDDPFVRPTPDADAAFDTAFDTAPTDADLDAPVDTDRPDDAATPDTDAPDAVVGELIDGDPSFTLAGTTDCLRYEIEISNTDFDFKNDDIRITYFVSNVCATPFRVRTAHFSDFFPIAIEKNGEPWIFLPDCIGTGAPYAYTFEPAEGVNRGWIWNASDHEARMERCGVTYEPDATYGVVGYGLTQLDMLDETSMSELVRITAPILITLRP